MGCNTYSFITSARVSAACGRIIMGEAKRRDNLKELREQQYQKRIKEYLEKRDALFNDPTLEGAIALHPLPPGGWRDPINGPLAAVHKARLQWINVTDRQIEESMHWLQMHNFPNTFNGAPPFTPETRDEERRQRGMEPLGQQ
jgi:hypothetical protein